MPRKKSESPLTEHPEQEIMSELAGDSGLEEAISIVVDTESADTSFESTALSAEDPVEEAAIECSPSPDEATAAPDGLEQKSDISEIDRTEPPLPGDPPIAEPNEESLPEMPVQGDPPRPTSKPAAKAAKTRAAKTKKANLAEPPPEEPPPEDSQKPKNARQAFYSLDFRTLDRDLSPEQEQEWNAIYASFRSRSILTGTVIGVDDHTFDITEEDGIIQRRSVRSLVIIGYRVKVMIPETEVWAVGEENPRYAIRGMVGAKVDYVIMSVDRENDCAVASRRMAMTKQRRHTLQTARAGRDIVTCDVLLVSRKTLMVGCGGFDLVLTQRDLSYTAIADLRGEYKPGMELRARLLDIQDGKPVVSVKEVNPNPFDGADQRHPVGCRRQAVIEGKYVGGVFCRLPDDTTCLCLYSNNHYDAAFETGDTVLVHITEFNYNRKLIYGRIVGKR